MAAAEPLSVCALVFGLQRQSAVAPRRHRPRPLGHPRGMMDNLHGAYFRDPDGNKLCVFTYENGGPALT